MGFLQYKCRRSSFSFPLLCLPLPISSSIGDDNTTIFNVWELSKRASNCLGETRAGRKKEPTMMVGVESSRRWFQVEVAQQACLPRGKSKFRSLHDGLGFGDIKAIKFPRRQYAGRRKPRTGPLLPPGRFSNHLRLSLLIWFSFSFLICKLKCWVIINSFQRWIMKTFVIRIKLVVWVGFLSVCFVVVIAVNLTQAKVIWEEEPQLKSCH